MRLVIFALAVALPSTLVHAATSRDTGAPVAASVLLPDAAGTMVFRAAPGRPGQLVLRRAGQKDAPIAIDSVRMALEILADPRLEPLWLAVLRWGGAGLEKLRDDRLAEARGIAVKGHTRLAFSTAASSVRPRVRAMLLLADELWEAGAVDEAQRVVSDARGGSPGPKDVDQAEWTATSVRLAGLRWQVGDPAGAFALLTESQAAVGDSTYAINFTVTRAALLAEGGRYSEALATIRLADLEFRAMTAPIDGGGQKVPGSDRQFAWIRACALKGLGRDAEAASIAATLGAAIEPEGGSLYVDDNRAIRLRMARCMSDTAAAARDYAAQLAESPVLAGATIDLQPGRNGPRFDPTFAAKVRRDPALASVLAHRMRILPPELLPALNGWRTIATAHNSN